MGSFEFCAVSEGEGSPNMKVVEVPVGNFHEKS